MRSPTVTRYLGTATTLLTLVLVACAEAGDQADVGDATETDAGAVSADAAVPADALAVQDLERTLGILHEKMTSLAEAMPEPSLGWRPMEGVRSVEEVYIHVAADNYFVPALLGWPAPAETGVTSDQETFRTYQAQTMTRGEMLAALDDSFSFMRDAMVESRTDLGREVTLGQPTTVGDVWIRAVVHLHEHLGQSIAYARSNGVVPPWSR